MENSADKGKPVRELAIKLTKLIKQMVEERKTGKKAVVVSDVK
jgi:hypothetical protein